jgi:bifunctional non-homologous end joining protein LigD
MSRRSQPLTEYQSKRDFTRTSEPSGIGANRVSASEHLRFVVQKHDATRLHYDLRLELGDVFKSWAVTRGPSLDPGEKRLAVAVEDHPLEYGDFEGTIPEGEYGGGSVMIWDRGFWAPETDKPPLQSLRDGELKFALAGQKLRGSFVLVRLKRRPGDRGDNWLLIKHRDEWATPGHDDVQAKDRSVASGRTMAQIAARKGKDATPFLTSGGKVAAAAVWDGAASARSRKATAARRTATGPSLSAEMPRLTHPDRVLWPDDEKPVTKRDLAEYLLAVAPWMMPHIHGRPCSLLRTPDGIGGEHFFQRHPMAGQPASLSTVTIDREHEPYVEIDDANTLVAMAQFSACEFHPGSCAPYQPQVPGRLVFDLDPAPDVPFAAVVEGARDVRTHLERLGLIAFCKTTGGKGLHVVVPLMPEDGVSWDQAKLFAQTVASQLADASPARYITTMAKQKRRGRIFIDYLRNDVTATAVAPLSPRARLGATVSMPLAWSQVRRDLDPARFTIWTAPALIARSTPWKNYEASARPLRDAIEALVHKTS